MRTCFRLACASLLSTVALGIGCAPAATSSSADKREEPPATQDAGGGGTDGGSTEDGGGPIGTAATSCGTGALFAGNPVYDGQPSDRPASGTGILADPPLQWQSLTFVGKNLYTRDTGEIWHVDTSAASPVEKLLVGKNPAGANKAFTDGPCATARFASIHAIAAAADGSLFVTDVFGNAILHVKDPTGPACAVEYWAGNHTANLDLDVNNTAPNTGADDGPGLTTAKLDGPTGITTDAAGNVYFVDNEMKIRKVAADAAHTVSTLGPMPAGGPDKIYNLTRIGNTVYGAGISADNKGHVIAVDTTTGSIKLVISGRGDTFPPVASASSPAIAGITTDGTGLIVSGAGYVWYLTPTGTLTYLAGVGTNIDFFAAGYDPKIPHPAKDLALNPRRGSSAVSIGSPDFITYHEGAVYYRGHGNGTAAYVERIACP
jgi:hypothetical protein